MGDKRLSARLNVDHASERLAGRPHRSQSPLPLVLFLLHGFLRAMRAGLVGELPDWISCSAGLERRLAGAHDADDDRARGWPPYAACDGLYRHAPAARAGSRTRHRRRNPAIRLLALALSRQPAVWSDSSCARGAVSAERPGRDATAQTRLDRDGALVPEPRAPAFWRRAHWAAIRSGG